MEEQPLPLDEMLSLAEKQCNGQLQADELVRLEHLLLRDAAARREYLRYRFLHAHLASTDAVMRSLHGENELRELTDQVELSACLAEFSEVSSALSRRADRRVGSSKHRLTAVVSAWGIAGTLLATLLISLFFVPPPGNDEVWRNSIARVIQASAAEWLDESDAVRRGQRLGPGTLRLRSGRAEVKFDDGAEIALHGPTTFGLESESCASLFAGKLWAKLTEGDKQFVLQAGSVRVVDRGTEFGVEIGSDGVTEVHCLDGEIETQARVRLPISYWSFDQANGRIVDNMTRQAAKAGSGTTHVGGLVGSGAMSFDNSRQAVVNVGNGGGTKIGTGRFGVSSGLTIEALTVVRWSGDGSSNGKPTDYDEIFRKEDGPKRMLLSFQNDGGARQRNVPMMSEYGPTLSFGLHLAGDGYSELEVRLDGEQGRPTLARLRDEKPHHIVATYDSWTGCKSLYIDGVLLQSAVFPKGTLIESGGPTDATIGNIAGGQEPYSGIIDEVAVYDFALTQEEIVTHWRNFQAGQNYFGADSSEHMRGSSWKSTQVLTAGQAMQFDGTTGLPVKRVPVNYARFRNG